MLDVGENYSKSGEEVCARFFSLGFWVLWTRLRGLMSLLDDLGAVA